MKHSAIQAAPRSAVRSGFSRLWPGTGLVALPFVLNCAISGCGNGTDTTATTPETSGNPMNADGTSANSDGNTTTVTQSNQPASNESTPTPALRAPGSSGSAASRDRDAGAPSTTPINPAASGLVPCGPAGRFCEKPNLTCCTPGGGAGQGANAATCQASAEDCPMGTVTIAACSSAASCAAREVCCRTPNAPAGGGGGNNGTTSGCADSCAAGSVQVCLSDDECGAGSTCGNNGACVAAPCTGVVGACATGEICCRAGGGGGGAATGTCVTPAAGAVCPAGQRQLCAIDADCPANNTCAVLAVGGGGGGAGVRACTPAPCTPGGCSAGQLCCVGGGGGGAPACAVANAAGSCPGNARLFCATDDDCASVAGTACRTAPNGAGALSCRVPPAPPPPAAEADAGG